LPNTIISDAIPFGVVAEAGCLFVFLLHFLFLLDLLVDNEDVAGLDRQLLVDLLGAL
jgi:hypothetical protein